MHNMKMYEELKEKLCIELTELAKKPDAITTQTLDNMAKLTDTIKNIDKIMLLEEGDMDSYSRADGGRRMYDRDSSYANRRGTHYVRGHYSRDDGDGYGGNYSERRDSRGRYSRDSGDDTMETLQELMANADERDREILKKCLRELEK